MKKKKKVDVPFEVDMILVEIGKVKVDYENQNSISYSQFSTYQTCPHQWYLTYVKKLGKYDPSIHTVFGTAFHETIQKWLEIMFTSTIKEAMEVDLEDLLHSKMISVYKKEKYLNGNVHFTTPEELHSFYLDGLQILDYLKKNRAKYFQIKDNYLVKDELPLLLEIKKNLFFKGYLDLVFYNKLLDKYTILDIKTSTKGWSTYEKSDENKTAQLILYKQLFGKQFNIDPEKIDVKFFIVKRKIPDEVEFASMGRRVQEFIPPSGKIKRKNVMNSLKNFIEACFDEDGQYIEKEYIKNASKNNCKFCQYRDNKYLCNQAIL
jgi:CRISPR/Cas system-associated exonuclease Cas4 (RecB family)